MLAVPLLLDPFDQLLHHRLKHLEVRRLDIWRALRIDVDSYCEMKNITSGVAIKDLKEYTRLM